MKAKAFDAVSWMRNRRIKIDEEDRDLSWAERRKKTRQLLETDPLWRKLRNRLVEPTGRASIAIAESRKKYGAKQK